MCAGLYISYNSCSELDDSNCNKWCCFAGYDAEWGNQEPRCSPDCSEEGSGLPICHCTWNSIFGVWAQAPGD